MCSTPAGLIVVLWTTTAPEPLLHIACANMHIMMRADDLLVLLEVARGGTFVAAGAALGLDHTTVSRRIAALERELGDRVLTRSPRGWELTELGRTLLASSRAVEQAVSDARRRTGRGGSDTLGGLVRIVASDGLGALFVAPVMARVHRLHPQVTLQLVTETRPLVQGAGVDLEIGVGGPVSRRLKVVTLSEYALGLYATEEYLQRAGEPRTVAELAGHSFVYYIDALVRVDDLGLIRELLPTGEADVASTNVFAHLEATRAGAGLGLLPAFIARRAPELRRVLADQVDKRLRYVISASPQAARRPAAMVVLSELQEEVRRRQGELLGTG